MSQNLSFGFWIKMACFWLIFSIFFCRLLHFTLLSIQNSHANWTSCLWFESEHFNYTQLKIFKFIFWLFLIYLFVCHKSSWFINSYLRKGLFKNSTIWLAKSILQTVFYLPSIYLSMKKIILIDHIIVHTLPTPPLPPPSPPPPPGDGGDFIFPPQKCRIF